MKIVNALLASTLLASVAIGLEMVATDSFLWSAAPSHAIGLLAFTLLALVLAVALLKLPVSFTRYAKYAFLGASLLSTIQLTLMIGDTIVGAPIGISQAAFSAYLLSNSAFTALLGIQPVTVTTGISAALLLSRKVRPLRSERVSLRAQVPAIAN